MCLEAFEYDADQKLTVIPCAEPHALEVVAEKTVPDGSYPGEDGLEQEAGTFCSSAADGLPSGQPFDLAQVRDLYPSEVTWDAGDRVISCLAEARDGTVLTGSFVAGDATAR
nr:septum formation family protein [Pseudactinotalea sp. HY160]